jgi:hypothetical protein
MTDIDHEIPEAEVVPEPDEPGVALEVQSHGALVSGRVVTGATADEVIAHATEIANSLDRLVKAQGFAVAMGGRKPHLEIGAWQALGALTGALGGEALHAETIPGSVKPVGEKTTYHVHEKKYSGPKGNRVLEKEIDYDVEGQDWEATVEVKTAGGVVIGRAAGMCSRAEPSWMPKPDPALRSMAETRAASRAFRAALGWIVAIAGYNPTPAEEMPAENINQYGKAATPEQVAQAYRAMTFMLQLPEGDERAHKAVDACCKVKADYYPVVLTRCIGLFAKTLKEMRDEQAKVREAETQTAAASGPADGDAALTVQEPERSSLVDAEAPADDDQPPF